MAKNSDVLNLAVPRRALTRGGFIVATIIVAAIIAIVVTLPVRALTPTDELAAQVNSADYQRSS